MTLGLLDMPADVMNKILEDIGIKTIMTLRKVCHDLRNYIDDVKPDANLEEISVFALFNDSIFFHYHFSGGYLKVEYKKHMEGCLARNNTDSGMMEKLLKNEDFVSIFLKDFEIVLRHQKSILKKFTVAWRCKDKEYEIILKNLQQILKSRVHPFKVEKFTAEYMDQNEIMSVLPFLDSKTLKSLEIRNHGDYLEIGQLVKLDQWKNSKHMRFLSTTDYKYIQHFTHFSKADVFFKSNHFPDLVSLKNLFTRSPGFQTITIRPTSYNRNFKRFMQSLGRLFDEVDLKKDFKHSWYYRIPDTNQILGITVINEVLWSKNMSIVLSRMEESNVPQGSVIRN